MSKTGFILSIFSVGALCSCAKATGPPQPPALADLSASLPPSQYSTVDVAIADLDGDGDMDIVWASQPDENNEPGAVEVTLNMGGGVFEAVDMSGIPDLGSWSFVLAADVDNDTDIDLVLTRPATTSTQVTVLVNSGAATFARYDTAVPLLSGENYGYAFGRVSAGDVDRDGDTDLVVPISFNTTFDDDLPSVLLLNDGDGYFLEDTEGRLPDIPDQADYTLSVAVGDADGDHFVDIYLGEAENQQRLLINDGWGFFTDETLDDGSGSPRLPTDPLRAYDCLMRDMNGDGHLDIVVVNDVSLTSGEPEMQGNHILLNDGSGHFTIAGLPTATGPHDARGLAIGDLNQDGIPDIVIANGTDTVSHGGSALEFLLGHGDGKFALADEVPTYGKGIFGVDVGDINGDGYPDIAAAVAEPDGNGDLANILLLTVRETE